MANVIKTCLKCGHTQRLSEVNTTCPKCNTVPMHFFENTKHLIRFIDNHGLGKLNIVNEDIREEVIRAFS